MKSKIRSDHDFPVIAVFPTVTLSFHEKGNIAATIGRRAFYVTEGSL
jgi:hypothetical protein